MVKLLFSFKLKLSKSIWNFALKVTCDRKLEKPPDKKAACYLGLYVPTDSPQLKSGLRAGDEKICRSLEGRGEQDNPFDDRCKTK